MVAEGIVDLHLENFDRYAEQQKGSRDYLLGYLNKGHDGILPMLQEMQWDNKQDWNLIQQELEKKGSFKLPANLDELFSMHALSVAERISKQNEVRNVAKQKRDKYSQAFAEKALEWLNGELHSVRDLKKDWRGNKNPDKINAYLAALREKSLIDMLWFYHGCDNAGAVCQEAQIYLNLGRLQEESRLGRQQ